MDRKRSEAFLAASSHWAANKKPRVSLKDDPICIESDDEEVVPEPKHFRSPIHLLYNPSYGDQNEKVNKDTVMMESLVGTQDLRETFQFNFNVDLEFFLGYLHPDMSKKAKKITFVTGSDLLSSEYPETSVIKSMFNISSIKVWLGRFASHHSKLMVNFFEDDTCEVVVMTANLTKLDFGGLTQMLWRSGRLKKPLKGSIQKAQGARFRKDLQDYLKRYGKGVINSLAKTLEDYDFLSVEVELVASAPGKYDVSKMSDTSEIYGYGKLLQVLRRNDLLVDNQNLDKKYNFLSQVTSIASPYTSRKLETASVFSHLLCPLVFSKRNFQLLAPGSKLFEHHQEENNYTPHLIFPTVEEVARSTMGYGTGQAIHFDYSSKPINRSQYQQNIKPYLRKWVSSSGITGRERVPPHCKLFLCDQGNNWSSLRWVLMGSNNLSKQGWGATKGTSIIPTEYEVVSYELGVLISSREYPLVPSYGTDTTVQKEKIPIRLPFMLPATNYSSNDRPWSMKLDYDNLADTHGQLYNPNKDNYL